MSQHIENPHYIDPSGVMLFDPKDEPFGRLSNNAKYKLSIGGVLWTSASNYIYSNIMPDVRRYKAVMDGIKDYTESYAFVNTLNEEKNEKMLEFMRDAMNVKFQNPEMADLLLSTGYSPLYYSSYDSFLGIGEDGNGSNKLGLELVQIRQQLRFESVMKTQKQIREQHLSDLYDAYIAYNVLRELIEKGDDLRDFVGQTHKQIVEFYENEKDIGKTLPTKEMFVSMYDNPHHLEKIRDLLESSIKYPSMLLKYVKKEGLGNLRERLIRKARRVALEIYSDCAMRKYKVDKDMVTEVKNKEINEIPYDMRKELEAEVFDMYVNGKMKASIIDKIFNEIQKLKIPTLEEVNDAKTDFVYIKPSIKSTKRVVEKLYDEGEKPIYFAESPAEVPTAIDMKYMDLSPRSETVRLNIQGREYPSASYYSEIKYVSMIPKVGLTKAYKLALEDTESDTYFKNIREYELLGYEMMNQFIILRIKRLTITALNEKFSNIELQQLLALTNDYKIWYTSPSRILGIGEENTGLNFVGETLMKIRDTIKLVRAKNTWRNVVNDYFIKHWLSIKISDFFKTLSIIQRYIMSDTVDIELVSEIYKVFYNCGGIFTSNNRTVHPDYYEPFVKTVYNIKKLDQEILDVVWTETSNPIYYIHKTTDRYIPDVIVENSMKMNNVETCKELSSIDNYDMCFRQSILNVAKKLTNFSHSERIDEKMLLTAASILTLKDIRMADVRNYSNKYIADEYMPIELDDRETYEFLMSLLNYMKDHSTQKLVNRVNYFSELNQN